MVTGGLSALNGVSHLKKFSQQVKGALVYTFIVWNRITENVGQLCTTL